MNKMCPLCYYGHLYHGLIVSNSCYKRHSLFITRTSNQITKATNFYNKDMLQKTITLFFNKDIKSTTKATHFYNRYNLVVGNIDLDF